MNKKHLILFVLLTASCWMHAQVVGPGFVNYMTSAPSGTCSQGQPMQVVMGLGTVYTCQSGTWATVGGGGGSSISGTLTSGIIPRATGVHSLGDGSISDDGAGNLSFTGTLNVFPDSAISGVEVDSDKFCIIVSCWYRGTGSPESAVTAATGSFYTQTDSGPGSSALWVKDNGVSNTGWEQLGLVLSSQYKILRCYPGLGDGLNAIAAGTYLQTNCYNNSGVTWTISRIGCFTDNAGSSTLSATNGAGTALLTGAVTCGAGAGGTAGTQSATVTIANGDVIKFTFIADGTGKQTGWFVTLTQ